MKIEKTVLARGANSITNGVTTRLTGLLDCPEAERAVKKVIRNFRRSFDRDPEIIQLAVSFVIQDHPGPNQRIMIPYWSFAARADDPDQPTHNPEFYSDPSDEAGPIELKHLGNGRYGLP